MYLLAHQLQCGILLDCGKIHYLQNNIKTQTYSCKCPYCIFKLKVDIYDDNSTVFTVQRPHTCFILPINQRITVKQINVYPIQIIKFLRIVQLEFNTESVKQLLCNLIITAINQFDIIEALNETQSQFIVPQSQEIKDISFYNTFAPDIGAIKNRAIKARKQNELLIGHQQQLQDIHEWNQQQIDKYIYKIMSQL